MTWFYHTGVPRCAADGPACSTDDERHVPLDDGGSLLGVHIVQIRTHDVRRLSSTQLRQLKRRLMSGSFEGAVSATEVAA